VTSSHKERRLARKHVNPMHSVLAGGLFLGSRAEAIETRSDTDVFQTDPGQIPDELRLRQSAGDSTGPQIDISAGILRELDIKGNIGQVKASARL